MSLDDELRRRLQQAADRAGAGTDPAALAQQVTTTAAAGARPPLRLLGAIGAVGLVAGGALGYTALQPDDTAGAAPAVQIEVQQYSLYDCPDGAPVGIAYPGDRVYVVGRNDGGDWLAVRDPRHQTIGRWVPADAVDPDAVSDVAVMTCSETIELLPADGTTTTAETSTTTSTTIPESTTTTSTTLPPTTVPATVAPTAPPTVPPTVPPNQPPTVGTIGASPGQITGLSDCGVSSSTISVTVTDSSGISSVRLDWSMPALPSTRSDSVVLTKQGNTYSVVIQPGNPDNQSRYVNLTITATDNQGLTTVRQAHQTLFVNYCLF